MWCTITLDTIRLLPLRIPSVIWPLCAVLTLIPYNGDTSLLGGKALILVRSVELQGISYFRDPSPPSPPGRPRFTDSIRINPFLPTLGFRSFPLGIL